MQGIGRRAQGISRSGGKGVRVWGFLCLCVLARIATAPTGCTSEPEERPPLPPVRLEDSGESAIDSGMAASIYLPGLPPETMVDDAGQIVVSSGLENVGVGTCVLLEGRGKGVQPEAVNSTYWTLERPPGSRARLSDHTSRTPFFLPDVTGHYTVGLTITSSEGVLGRPAELTIHAGTWVGNGAVFGPSGNYRASGCAACHPEETQTWRGTRHAVTLKRAMDGQASPYYLENCIHCHTVGKNALANNGGFDDVARDLGWTYPTELRPGNYTELLAGYPRLANLGNTQCECCHGPGSDHDDDDGNIAVSLRPELCIQCHDFLQQDRYAQWARSGHANTSLPYIFPDGIDDPVCSSCHTTRAYVAAAEGAEIVAGDREQLTCQACHDPHKAGGANSYQLRYYGSIQLPDGTNMMNLGSSAICIHCHNVGETPDVVEEQDEFLPPQAAAAEMIAGVGGYTYGETLDNSSHVNSARWHGACVSCHMVSSGSVDASGAEGFLSATMNEPVGEHTFLVRWDNGTPGDSSDDYENLAACEGCHPGVNRINGPAGADYDGDGNPEGVQDEVQGLLDLVRAEILALGIEWSGHAPYWGPGRSLDQRAAIYNWSYVNNDGSRGIHNTARAVELLQLTYRRLTGQEVPGAVLRAGNPPESTFRDRFSSERLPLVGISWSHIAIPLALLGLLAALAIIIYRARLVK